MKLISYSDVSSCVKGCNEMRKLQKNQVIFSFVLNIIKCAFRFYRRKKIQSRQQLKRYPKKSKRIKILKLLRRNHQMKLRTQMLMASEHLLWWVFIGTSSSLNSLSNSKSLNVKLKKRP